MEINFCNNAILSDPILTLVNEEITPGISKNEILGYYKKWQENFNENNDDFEISNKSIATDFELPENKSLVGIDFPIWFNIEPSNAKKIMVIGIDPLRNASAFEGCDSQNDALIGTPYALHRKPMRESSKEALKPYWGFMNSILNKNYGVYITDIFKVFFMSQNQRSYNHKHFIENKQKHLKQILDREIKIVNPDLIIVLGNKPLNSLVINKNKISNKILESLEYNGIPILPMVHLSGLASGGRKKFIANNLPGVPITNDIDAYLKIVDNFINNH